MFSLVAMHQLFHTLKIRLFGAAFIFLALLPMQSAAELAAEPKIEVNVAKRSDAFVVDALIVVAVPLEIAWGVLVDIDHSASFLENMTYSKVIGHTGDGLIARQEGSARFGLFSFPFVTERVVRLQPMKHIATRQLSGTFKRMESEASFAVIESNVRIRYRAEIEPDSQLVLMFGQTFVRHEVTEQFRQMSREMLRRNSAAQRLGGPIETSTRASEFR